MRIAFLTPEYPSEYPDAGGLATYVHRISHLLAEAGHEAEVFVSSDNPSATTIDDGVVVHRINWRGNIPVLRGVPDISSSRERSEMLRHRLSWLRWVKWMLRAKAVAVALERRHADAPFRLVQSSDYLATGLFVRRRADRVHAVRCSSASDLYGDVDQTPSVFKLLRSGLERLTMRGADVVYAPSKYIADHLRSRHGLDVRVVRPPIYSGLPEVAEPSFPLPMRFLFHFGQLTARKGTSLIAEALPLAWKIAPELTMVWSGNCPDQNDPERWRSRWGARASQVIITGPLGRPVLYGVLRKAEATVLPSQVDNLPNTVIESLLFGIPVIGSRGASIDELVEEARTGRLIELGDVDGLAQAMATTWLGDRAVPKGFGWRSELTADMEPQRAIANLIALASGEAGNSEDEAGGHRPRETRGHERTMPIES